MHVLIVSCPYLIICCLGGEPLDYLFIDSDGSPEDVQVLREEGELWSGP